MESLLICLFTILCFKIINYKNQHFDIKLKLICALYI